MLINRSIKRIYQAKSQYKVRLGVNNFKINLNMRENIFLNTWMNLSFKIKEMFENIRNCNYLLQYFKKKLIKKVSA